MSKIRPLEDRVLIKQDPAMAITPSGIVIPMTARTAPSTGTVLAVGPGELNEKGHRVPLDVSPGDRVYFSQWGGIEVNHDGERAMILWHRDIIGVAPQP